MVDYKDKAFYMDRLKGLELKFSSLTRCRLAVKAYAAMSMSATDGFRCYPRHESSGLIGIDLETHRKVKFGQLRCVREKYPVLSGPNISVPEDFVFRLTRARRQR
ncbi:hypothetical protein EVAR_20203_1 [Eumeta japonica]|uniref:Uncharacterized protein n=1 Tax=Eumeta variegata TaxID=151549 RepID=A0A4C1UTQ6_EUMVA|nr:hypothetical protein EVAR_20203_1 [Eumeta japonica]